MIWLCSSYNKRESAYRQLLGNMSRADLLHSLIPGSFEQTLIWRITNINWTVIIWLSSVCNWRNPGALGGGGGGGGYGRLCAATNHDIWTFVLLSVLHQVVGAGFIPPCPVIQNIQTTPTRHVLPPQHSTPSLRYVNIDQLPHSISSRRFNQLFSRSGS